MQENQRLDVFHAQTKNIRKLNKARKQIVRVINHALRKKDSISAEIHTKALVLVFCAWVEAQFSKVIHTPYGFNSNEIQQIKGIYQLRGIEAGWKKCIELGLRKTGNPSKSNYIPNIRQKLSKIIEDYVIEPSFIRNKIAHGQWEIALNRDNTAINNDITSKLRNLDIVDISRWFDIYSKLAKVLEMLIESPNRAFHRDYWTLVTELENIVEGTANWNLAEKIIRLQKKPIHKQKS